MPRSGSMMREQRVGVSVGGGRAMTAVARRRAARARPAVPVAAPRPGPRAQEPLAGTASPPEPGMAAARRRAAVHRVARARERVRLAALLSAPSGVAGTRGASTARTGSLERGCSRGASSRPIAMDPETTNVGTPATSIVSAPAGASGRRGASDRCSTDPSPDESAKAAKVGSTVEVDASAAPRASASSASAGANTGTDNASSSCSRNSSKPPGRPDHHQRFGLPVGLGEDRAQPADEAFLGGRVRR